MLLGVIVRSKAVFKRPRALSQRSLSPPPKRRISSASVETSSSDGGTAGSPANKRDTLSELRDSPPADIDDIVFQYNTTQAKIAGKESKDTLAKASPASEGSTPSVASSTGAALTPSASADKSSVPSLEEQKQQLLDLQERARQYILAQTQRKGTSLSEAQGTHQEKPESSDTNVDQQGGKGGVNDDDAPYDPEEGLELDLDIVDPTPPNATATAAKPEEPSKPSSLEVLVSTLQRLQGATLQSATPKLSALSSILPQAALATSKVGPTQPKLISGVTPSTAVSTASVDVHPASSVSSGPQSSVLASGILQPIAPFSRELKSTASPDSASQPPVSTSHGSQPSSVSYPKPLGLTGRLSQPVVSTGDNSHPAISSTQGPQLSPSSDQRCGRALSSAQRLQPQRTEQRLQPGSSSYHRPHHGPSSDQRLRPGSSSEHRPQPRPCSDIRPRPGPSSDHRMQAGPSSDNGLHAGPSTDHSLEPGSSSTQRNQPAPSESFNANRWNPSEPPQVTRQVNNITQDIRQCGGLRPEDRARLAAHESRMESRDNRRSSSDRGDEHLQERRMDDRHRSGWYNDPRYPRDSRDSRDDSRRNWRDDYRHGRSWYSDEQRRDSYEHPIDERSRHEDRRQERRFKEHWNRDRWRR